MIIASKHQQSDECHVFRIWHFFVGKILKIFLSFPRKKLAFMRIFPYAVRKF